MKAANEDVLTATAVMDALEACDKKRFIFQEDVHELLTDIKVHATLKELGRIMKYE